MTLNQLRTDLLIDWHKLVCHRLIDDRLFLAFHRFETTKLDSVEMTIGVIPSFFNLLNPIPSLEQTTNS